MTLLEARATAGIMLVLVVAAFAGPKIKVDNAEYDAGSILEGSLNKIRHEFKISNTGDEPLTIKQVKPG